MTLSVGNYIDAPRGVRRAEVEAGLKSYVINRSPSLPPGCGPAAPPRLNGPCTTSSSGSAPWKSKEKEPVKKFPHPGTSRLRWFLH